jgi:AraC-like DNA-binding protein
LGNEWRAVADPAVARAVKMIQERFAEEDLDLATVSREAGVSRSVLRDRFVQLLGEPPMRYRAKWRMRTAAQLLREGKANTANIAFAVGFNSEAAFTRAFKREFGQPPATWKRRSHEEFAYDPRPSKLFVSGAPTGVNWISRHIGGFLEENPDISVQLEPNPRTLSFEIEDIDVAIHCGTNAPSDVKVEELFRLDFTPMCSPEFLAAHPNLKNPVDLLDVQRITPSDPWWQIWWRHFDLEPPAGTPRGVEMRAQVLDGLAAMRGQGVALLTPFFWSEELADGRLVAPLPHVVSGTEVYSLTYPRARADWAKVRRFSEWLHGLSTPAVMRSRPTCKFARAA